MICTKCSAAAGLIPFAYTGIYYFGRRSPVTVNQGTGWRFGGDMAKLNTYDYYGRQFTG